VTILHRLLTGSCLVFATTDFFQSFSQVTYAAFESGRPLHILVNGLRASCVRSARV